MEPVFFLSFGLAVIGVTAMAIKETDASVGFLFLIWTYALMFGHAVVDSGTAIRNANEVVIAAFFSPVVILLINIILSVRLKIPMPKEKEEVEFSKCPFCIEAARKGDTKCKLCGSEVQPKI